MEEASLSSKLFHYITHLEAVSVQEGQAGWTVQFVQTWFTFDPTETNAAGLCVCVDG